MQQLGLRAAPFMVGFTPAAVRRIRNRPKEMLQGREVGLAYSAVSLAVNLHVTLPVPVSLPVSASLPASASLFSCVSPCVSLSLPACLVLHNAHLVLGVLPSAAWALCVLCSCPFVPVKSGLSFCCSIFKLLLLLLLVQVFVYRAYHVPGRPQVSPPPDSPVRDWAWVAAEEAKRRMPPASFAAIRDALLQG